MAIQPHERPTLHYPQPGTIDDLLAQLIDALRDNTEQLAQSQHQPDQAK